MAKARQSRLVRSSSASIGCWQHLMTATARACASRRILSISADDFDLRPQALDDFPQEQVFSAGDIYLVPQLVVLKFEIPHA
jgi:hypothetical protein